MPKMNFQGKEVDATDVEFHTRKEDWNEYQLVDGTVVKLKLVVSQIFKIDDMYDHEGNPIYQIKSTNVAAVNSPEGLKKKP